MPTTTTMINGTHTVRFLAFLCLGSLVVVVNGNTINDPYKLKGGDANEDGGLSYLDYLLYSDYLGYLDYLFYSRNANAAPEGEDMIPPQK